MDTCIWCNEKPQAHGRSKFCNPCYMTVYRLCLHWYITPAGYTALKHLVNDQRVKRIPQSLYGLGMLDTGAVPTRKGIDLIRYIERHRPVQQLSAA